MNKKELKKKLSEAKEYRKLGYQAESIAVLHQVVAEYPEPKYLYLLAATYLETGENDIALQYLDEALNIDVNYKEAYELKAKIYENKKEYQQAEQMYLTALEIDPDFFNARDSLVDLYWHKFKDYDKTIEQCEYVFDRYNIYTFPREEMPEKDPWLSSFYPAARSSYIKQKRYDDLIRLIDRYKYIVNNYLTGGEEYLFSSEDDMLYKLYYLWGKKEKQEELKKKLKEYYRMSDKYIRSLEKDAEQGFIDRMNKDNYEINSNGTLA